MAKVKGIDLSDDARAALERAWRHGGSHEYRQRCRMVLLKSRRVDGQHPRSKEVAEQVGCCEPVVNT